MFGRRRRKRETVLVDAPGRPVCGQVYLFQRERAEREERERAESVASPTDEADEQRPPD